MKTKDITGLKFNRLTAIRFDNISTKNKSHLWYFKCECGKEVLMRKEQVTSGWVKSCGCLRDENRIKANKTHGLTKSHPLWKVWQGMKARCYYKKSKYYPIYGGSGVSVCREWKDDFLSFFNWSISNGWEIGKQIDKDILCEKMRVSPAIYSPQTCLFVSAKVNSNKTSRNRFLEFNGIKKTLAEWEETTGIRQSTIFYRLKYGWDAKSALTIPSTKTGKRKCFH